MSHQIGQYRFEFWRGSQPTHIREHVQSFTRAGTAGTAHRTLGKRAETFECELVSWHPSYTLARVVAAQMGRLVGTTQDVIHEDVNLKAAFNLGYVIESVELAECRANVRLLGPGINYPGGAELVTRWRMTPIDLSAVAAGAA